MSQLLQISTARQGREIGVVKIIGAKCFASIAYEITALLWRTIRAAVSVYYGILRFITDKRNCYSQPVPACGLESNIPFHRIGKWISNAKSCQLDCRKDVRRQSLVQPRLENIGQLRLCQIKNVREARNQIQVPLPRVRPRS
jgi:hypothetical protein